MGEERLSAESVRNCAGYFEFLCEHGHHVTSKLQANMETCPAMVFSDGEPVIRGPGGAPCGMPMESRVIDYEPVQIDGEVTP